MESKTTAAADLSRELLYACKNDSDVTKGQPAAIRPLGIKTAYDTLKSKFQLENFSGKTEVSVLQNFYATVYLAGLAAICAAASSYLQSHRCRICFTYSLPLICIDKYNVIT